MEQDIVKIGQYSDDTYHIVYINIPNEDITVSNNGDSITVKAKWIKQNG